MEVHLNAELQTKLSRMAAEQGRAAEALVEEAVARLVEYDDWFLREVDKGLSAADRGDWIEHSEIRRLIDDRFRG